MPATDPAAIIGRLKTEMSDDPGLMQDVLCVIANEMVVNDAFASKVAQCLDIHCLYRPVPRYMFRLVLRTAEPHD